ncbi:hypothetical protein QM588_04715 [Rhodococcus sp. IEGM 1354]|uniref:esterase/lipase family protein n=1 Tax=Rhodococcus sp. IEGM 1354 TaxID=3047088 RepID=UPI0024B79499|nr:hypothetical protein [Rhodococcus sp. IEGM 1354]MDI9929702.1 hypothetical protein [Rhodococcus sp. IEGM 1354]
MIAVTAPAVLHFASALLGTGVPSGAVDSTNSVVSGAETPSTSCRHTRLSTRPRGRNPPNREWFDNGRVIPQNVELCTRSKWNTLYNNAIRFTLFIGTAVAALSDCAGTTASVEPDANPQPVPFGTDAVPASLLPEAAAPGGNMSFCKPSGAGLNTVVLVNPAMTSQGPAWQTEASFLFNDGYCLYTFDFEQISGTPEALALTAEYVESFARTLAETVNRFLADTGASKVDLVGHAEVDGIIPGYYINRPDGAIEMVKVVVISLIDYTAAVDSGAHPTPPTGSDDYESLAPGIGCTTIVTTCDAMIIPFSLQFLEGPSATNVVLPSDCEVDRSEHFQTLHNRRVRNFVLNALDPAHATPAPCDAVGPASTQ